MPRSAFGLAVLVLLLTVLLLTGCVPYTVGNTAQPAPAREWVTATTAYFIPNGVNFQDPDYYEEGERSEVGAAFVGTDTEVRYGIDEVSDIGVRAPGNIGLVLNYKRRVTGSSEGPALALIGGAGFLNAGTHGHFELTAVVSGVEAAPVTPYGGLRAMQAVPVSSAYPSDEPTLGGFAGLRIGDGPTSVSVELGFF